MSEASPPFDEDVSHMPHSELRSQWDAIVEELRGPILDSDRHEKLWYRRRELWNEMKSRVDVEPPECTECGGSGWSQTMGDPKICDGCGLELGIRHEDLIQEIDEYWETILSGPGSPEKAA